MITEHVPYLDLDMEAAVIVCYSHDKPQVKHLPVVANRPPARRGKVVPVPRKRRDRNGRKES